MSKVLPPVLVVGHFVGEFAGKHGRDEGNLRLRCGEPGDGLGEDLAATLDRLRVEGVGEGQDSREAAFLGHVRDHGLNGGLVAGEREVAATVERGNTEPRTAWGGSGLGGTGFQPVQIFLSLGFGDAQRRHHAGTARQFQCLRPFDDYLGGVGERERAGRERRRHFPETVTVYECGLDSGIEVKPVHTDLQGEEDRLADVRLINGVVAAKNLFDQAAAPRGLHDRVEFFARGAENRVGLEQVAGHARPLRALSRKDDGHRRRDQRCLTREEPGRRRAHRESRELLGDRSRVVRNHGHAMRMVAAAGANRAGKFREVVGGCEKLRVLLGGFHERGSRARGDRPGLWRVRARRLLFRDFD